VQGYSSWIANVDGSNAHQIERSGGNSASLEIGQFTADSSKLLVDDADFGSVEDFYVNVPGSTVQDWTAQTDLLNTDSAYDQPDVRGSFLATVGFSSIVSRNALRVWNFNGFSSDPGNHCDYQSPVADAGFNDLEWLSRPSLSPDGAAVVWEDSSSSGSVSQTGQGIYTVPTSTIANSCATKSTLLIPGGEDPYWTAAGVTPPPSVLITSHPASVTNSTSASVSFTVAHAGTGLSVTCKLDSGAASPCSSPASFSGLANGSHTLTITAQDSVGASSAAATWRVDTTKPTVTLSAPTAVAALSTSNVRDAWSGSDTGSGIKSYTEQYQTAKYSSGFSSWTTLPGAGSESASTTSDSWTNFSLGYTYCFRIKATDGAGNTGYSNTRCFAVALDDRSAAASSGWTRGTGSSYYKGTVTSTKKLGATLTRTGGVSIKHVGVVAKTCSSCGTVGLYIGSKYLGKINLASSATHYKVIKMLPAISARSGTVTVKVLSSGKTVAIDGVVISRS
jgi:hypothetical protein